MKSLLNCRIVIRSRRKLRQLLRLSENNKGDVYVRLYSGPRRGPFEVREHRFSVHASPMSPTLNTIKSTMSFLGGHHDVKSVQITSALKSTVRLAPVVSLSFSDLAHDFYDAKSERAVQAIELPAFDPARCTLFASLLVANRHVASIKLPKNVDVIACRSMLFTIFVVYRFLPLPSTKFPEVLEIATTDPVLAPNMTAADIMQEAMSGLPIEATADYINAIDDILIESHIGKLQLIDHKNARELQWLRSYFAGQLRRRPIRLWTADLPRYPEDIPGGLQEGQ